MYKICRKAYKRNIMNLDNLIFEKVYIIIYQSQYSKGKMVMTPYLYNKKNKKIQKALKDCIITEMRECVLTPEIVKELDL